VWDHQRDGKSLSVWQSDDQTSLLCEDRIIKMEESEMTRDDNRQSQSALGNIKGVSVERDYANGEVYVSVLSLDTALFERWINDQYDIMDSRWAAVKSSDLPISRDDFLKYCYTAVRTRVARVRDEKFPIRCDSPWMLPTGLATVLGMLGRALTPGATYLPMWDTANDDRITTSREEFHRLSARLRIIHDDAEVPFMFARGISGDRDGDSTLMVLLPVRDELGKLLKVRGQKDFDAIAAFAFLIFDLSRGDLDGLALDDYPALAPQFLRAAVIMQYMTRYAEISIGAA